MANPYITSYTSPTTPANISFAYYAPNQTVQPNVFTVREKSVFWVLGEHFVRPVIDLFQNFLSFPGASAQVVQGGGCIGDHSCSAHPRLDQVTLLTEQLEATKAIYGDKDPKYREALEKLANAYEQQYDFSEALKYWLKAAELSRTLTGDATVAFAVLLRRIATGSRIEENIPFAKELLEKGCNILKRNMWGREHELMLNEMLFSGFEEATMLAAPTGAIDVIATKKIEAFAELTDVLRSGKLKSCSSVLSEKIHLLPPQQKGFGGRGTVLNRLNKYFGVGTTSELLFKTSTLVGPDGIGKTEIAKAFAHQQAANYPLIVWMDGKRLDYRPLGEALKIVSPTDKDKVVSKTVKEWLEGHTGWLLIVDDAPNPLKLAVDLPSSLGGHILYTSSNPEAPHPFFIPPFSSEDALQWMEKEIGDGERELTLKIAEALEFNPIAIKGAIAILKKGFANSIFYFDRIAILEQILPTPKTLFFLQLKEHLAASKTPVEAIWKYSIEQISSLWPFYSSSLTLLEQVVSSSLALLEQIAFLSPDAIPPSLFSKEDLSILLDYHLLAPEEAEGYYSVHPELQAMIRERLSTNEQEVILLYLETRFYKKWNYDQTIEGSKKNEALVKHLEVYCRYANQQGTPRRQTGIFFNRLGLYHGYDHAAISHYSQALEIFKKLPGEERLVRTISYNIGSAYDIIFMFMRQQDALDKAIEFFQSSLNAGDPYDAFAAEIHTKLGYAYLEKNDLPLATQHLNDSFTIVKKLQINADWMWQLSKGHRRLAKAYLDDVQLAVDYFTKSIEMSTSDEDHPVALVGDNDESRFVQVFVALIAKIRGAEATEYTKTIVERLRLSPISIWYAANFMHSHELSEQQYLELLAHVDDDIFGLKAACKATLEEIGKGGSEALSYFHQAAYLSPENIPEQFLEVYSRDYAGHPVVQTTVRKLLTSDEEAAALRNLEEFKKTWVVFVADSKKMIGEIQKFTSYALQTLARR